MKKQISLRFFLFSFILSFFSFVFQFFFFLFSHNEIGDSIHQFQHVLNTEQVSTVADFAEVWQDLVPEALRVKERKKKKKKTAVSSFLFFLVLVPYSLLFCCLAFLHFVSFFFSFLLATTKVSQHFPQLFNCLQPTNSLVRHFVRLLQIHINILSPVACDSLFSLQTLEEMVKKILFLLFLLNFF